MTDALGSPSHAGDIDVGEYCRRVEEHLARANDGHLIRIVGPGFELVRGWAIEGVPLSIVCHGISEKAERHRSGSSKRPLRLEFCEGDVRAAFDGWRRAVRIGGAGIGAESDAETTTPEERRRPSLTRHLDRAIDRLSHVAGRLDLSDGFREVVGTVLQDAAALRDAAKSTRGPAREALVPRLPELDYVLVNAARREVGADTLDRLTREAADELATFRTRLSPGAWERSLALSADRMLRDRLGLPTFDEY